MRDKLTQKLVADSFKGYLWASRRPSDRPDGRCGRIISVIAACFAAPRTAHLSATADTGPGSAAAAPDEERFWKAHEGDCRRHRTPRQRAVEPEAPRGFGATSSARNAAGTMVTAGVAIATLTWAKWYPYALKIPIVADSHSLGNSILSGKASAPPSPSWNAAVEYTLGYVGSIWQALVAGLLVAAAVEAFLPARRLFALFQTRRGPTASTVCGGLLSMSSMMCTCCAAPVALNVRRRGVPVSSALAYWLGNPVPWQFVVVRIGTGVILVFAITLLVSRLATGTSVTEPEDDTVETGTAGGSALRLAKALVRLAVRLLPEYAVVVLLLGGFRGWLFPDGSILASWGCSRPSCSPSSEPCS
jgi:hypothetical protein